MKDMFFRLFLLRYQDSEISQNYYYYTFKQSGKARGGGDIFCVSEINILWFEMCITTQEKKAKYLMKIVS